MRSRQIFLPLCVASTSVAAAFHMPASIALRRAPVVRRAALALCDVPSEDMDDFLCDAETTYCVSPLGIKYIDSVLGSGEEVSAVDSEGVVVEVEYEATLLSSRQVIGTTDKSAGGPGPMVFIVGRDNSLPFWSDVVGGMRVGGVRRALVPPSAKLRPNYPMPDDETTRIDVRLQSIVTGPRAAMVKAGLSGAGTPGRGNRLRLAVLLLTSIPYFLPEEQRPWLWKSGSTRDVEEAVFPQLKEEEEEAAADDITRLPSASQERRLMRDERRADAELFGAGVGNELYGK